MNGSRATGWVVGTVLLVLAIFAATWFLLAAPRLEAAGATMLEAENTSFQNDLLRTQNAQLKADFENLEAYKAEVATLQQQIPGTAALPAYARIVDQLAETNGVTLLSVAPGAATVFTVPSPVAAAPAPAPVEGAAPGESDVSAEPETGTVADANLGSGEPAAPVGPVAPEGLVAVPFTFTVLGTYDATYGFLAGLQTGTQRLFLVTQVDATRQQAAEATASKPAIADGDVELTVTGYTYVLPDAVVPTEPPVEGEEPAPAPLPTTDRNPFAPLG